MSPEAIYAATGAVLSLALNYVPRLRDSFVKLTPDQRRGAMTLMLAVAAAAMAAWSCSDPSMDRTQICPGGVWRTAVESFFIALVSNQATDRISPKQRSEK